MKHNIIFIILVACIIIIPQLSFAQIGSNIPLRYSPPCLNVPGIPCSGPTTADIPIQQYLIRIYQFAIGVSGVVAVGMIVWGGILISLSESIDKIGDGKDKIQSAFLGIVLLFGSYLLLRTINPDIVALREPTAAVATQAGAVASTTPTTPAVSTTCPAVTSIPINGNIGTTEPNGGGMCRYKRVRGGGSISSDAYYNSSMSFPAGTLLWFYPYYPANEGGTSAMCLIYAIKEPAGTRQECVDSNCFDVATTPTVTMTPLRLDALKKCANGPTEEGASLTDIAAALAQLAAHHVSVSSSGNCSDRTQPNCTSLDGMPQSAIDYLSNLGDWCAEPANACQVTVTGGTEVGHNAHGVGKPVFDLSISGSNWQKIAEHVYPTASQICTMPADAQYRKNCTYDETSPHLHIGL